MAIVCSVTFLLAASIFGAFSFKALLVGKYDRKGHAGIAATVGTSAFLGACALAFREYGSVFGFGLLMADALACAACRACTGSAPIAKALPWLSIGLLLGCLAITPSLDKAVE